MHNSLLPPGIIRCNETVPCSGFVWNNVQSTSFHGLWEFLGLGFISEHVNGVVTNSNPVPVLDGGIHNFEWHKFVKKEIKRLIKDLVCRYVLHCDDFDFNFDFVDKMLPN